MERPWTECGIGQYFKKNSHTYTLLKKQYDFLAIRANNSCLECNNNHTKSPMSPPSSKPDKHVYGTLMWIYT